MPRMDRPATTAQDISLRSASVSAKRERHCVLDIFREGS